MPKETDRLKLPLPLGNENVTRESINGIFEKIDAGVATRESILIPAESDLNSYITEGEYYCPTNATVGTLANSPVGVAFHLTIEKHAGVVQTLTTFEPSNLQVFQRNYYVGWGPWIKVPTRDDIEAVKEYTDQKVEEIVINDASLTDKGIVQLSNAVDGTREDVAATEKAVRDARVEAETNAKSYAEANFNKPSELMWGNVIKNSSGGLGLSNWTAKNGSTWITSSTNARLSGYFAHTPSVNAGEYAILDSDTIVSIVSGTYHLQALFYTTGQTTGGIRVEILNAADNSEIGRVSADLNTGWHRKTTTITIPNGVNIVVRLAAGGPLVSGTKAFSRIKLTPGARDVPYSNEGDINSLFQSVSEGKGLLETAITGKGSTVSKAGSVATFSELVSGVGGISTGMKVSRITGLNVVQDSDNYITYVINDLPFKPILVEVLVTNFVRFNQGSSYDNQIDALMTADVIDGVLKTRTTSQLQNYSRGDGYYNALNFAWRTSSTKFSSNSVTIALSASNYTNNGTTNSYTNNFRLKQVYIYGI
ncbi:tail fiber protein [Paenibacillus sp. LS1]|uniref:tail fiber protein n=1 Tax=Paenibacillus sp. LS1 TaxID=2992120 RepID=UPI002230B6E7|nr:tail fiber protein [Paenibacillus sp. LS1]MCW3793497.1 tail fiber protein [Paenibacillus sp. LS1]